MKAEQRTKKKHDAPASSSMPADASIPAAAVSPPIIDMTISVSAPEVPEIIVVPFEKTGGDDTHSGEASVQEVSVSEEVGLASILLLRLRALRR